MIFKDNFSTQADLYAKHRPLYPVELYSFLHSISAENKLVWDCGTGNGQAAIGLAEFYDEIIATDPSAEQIKNCLPHKKIKYLVEKAEKTSLKSHSVNLLTVANALHWFDFAAFYKEAFRVLKNDGVIAVWTYGIPSVSPKIDKIIRQFHDQTLNDYWLPENRLIEDGYTTIPFPFTPIECPEFFYEKIIKFHDLIGYLHTWSATQRFIKQNNFNPIKKIQNDLAVAWGDLELERKMVWRLILKVGKA